MGSNVLVREREREQAKIEAARPQINPRYHAEFKPLRVQKVLMRKGADDWKSIPSLDKRK